MHKPPAALFAALVVLAGCTGDDDGNSADPDGSESATDGGDVASGDSYPAEIVGEGPIAGDHWHQAYAFYTCDPSSGEMRWSTLSGPRETFNDAGQIVDQDEEYTATGVHGHDDGVIHWHPFFAAATGTNATLGLFLDVYDVELTDSELTLPAEQGGATYTEGPQACGGETGELSVTVWPDYSAVEESATVTEGLAGVPVVADGEVFVVGFAPEGTEIPQPEWAPDLPELGAADGG